MEISKLMKWFLELREMAVTHRDHGPNLVSMTKKCTLDWFERIQEIEVCLEGNSASDSI